MVVDTTTRYASWRCSPVKEIVYPRWGWVGYSCAEISNNNNNNFRFLCSAISSRSQRFHITDTVHIIQCNLVAAGIQHQLWNWNRAVTMWRRFFHLLVAPVAGLYLFQLDSYSVTLCYWVPSPPATVTLPTCTRYLQTATGSKCSCSHSDKDKEIWTHNPNIKRTSLAPCSGENSIQTTYLNLEIT